MNYATDVSPIVVDVETAGLPNAADFLEPVTPDSRLKDPEKIKADITEKEQARLQKVALDWNVGRIAALAWWTEASGVKVHTCDSDAEEEAILRTFWLESKHRTIVGFNVKGFDLRFMVQRSRYLGITYPQLDFSKYSRKGIVDLYLDLTFGDGTYDSGCMRRTLKQFCKRFGIPINDEIDGKDIPALVAAGEWEKVAAHVTADVVSTVALARRLGVIQAQPEPAGAL